MGWWLAGAGLAGWLAACGSPSAPTPPAAPPALPPVDTTAGDATFVYRVRYEPGVEELAIAARLPPHRADELIVDPGLEPFVRDVRATSPGAPSLTAIAPAPGGGFRVRCDDGCGLDYRFALGEAADAIGRDGYAARRGSLIIAPPSAWLLRPEPLDAASSYAFTVETPDDVDFVTGVQRAEDGDGFAAPLSTLPLAPYSVFGRLDRTSFEFDGGRLELAVPRGALGGELALAAPEVHAWVDRAGTLVSDVYGVFPLPHIQVVLLPSNGNGLGFFRVLGHGGATVLGSVGRGADPSDLDRDWRLLHELIHTGIPNVPRRSRWLEEGIATYVEPIARARAGFIEPDEVWEQFVSRMPLGQPGAGDQGLDRTPTWGRIYWGGAAFCLLADVEIRRATQGSKTFEDALRAVFDQGGTIATSWPLERVLAEADRAVGTDALQALHARYGADDARFPLDELFQSLGVQEAADGVILDDAAPEASLRRAITSR